MKNNGEKMTEITVKSQKEFDAIPGDYEGRIYVEFGTLFNKAIINRSFVHSVVAWGNSSVEARGNSSVVARGNSSVEAWENSSVEARGNSFVVARENSSVVARGNSSVEAWGNTQVVNNLSDNYGRIEISGNARVVFMPKTIEEFMAFYNIKHDEKKAVFFKAVRKHNNTYVSDYDSDYEYKIGNIVLNECDADTTNDCSYGIHIAHLAWCMDFGRGWSDLAIIEVETDIDKIVLPRNTNGKVRTSEIKVLREIPLEEFGVFGKILAKRIKGE